MDENLVALEMGILRSLRQITRAIDLHSRRLANTFGLTAPQLVCLKALEENGFATIGELARTVSLSQATLTGIVDRLAGRQLVERGRGEADRRVVTVSLTAAGRALLAEAPSPLQDRFLEEFGRLDAGARRNICDTLGQIVRMMNGDDFDADTLLSAPLPPIEDA